MPSMRRGARNHERDFWVAMHDWLWAARNLAVIAAGVAIAARWILVCRVPERQTSSASGGGPHQDDGFAAGNQGEPDAQGELNRPG
jgi:hypothetical protein